MKNFIKNKVAANKKNQAILLLTFLISSSLLAFGLIPENVSAQSKPQIKCLVNPFAKNCRLKPNINAPKPLPLGRLGPQDRAKCNNTKNAKKCKREFDRCSKKNGLTKNERNRCQGNVISNFKKSKNPKNPGRTPRAIKNKPQKDKDTYKGQHQCGNIRDPEGKPTGDNFKTKFNFRCLGTNGPKGLNPIEDLLYAFLRFISIGVGIAVAIAMISSGIQYTASEGNAETTTKAKNRIRATMIGLLVYIFAFSLFQFLVPGGLFKPGFWLDTLLIIRLIL